MSWYDEMVAAGDLGDTGELSLRAYGEFAAEHQASALSAARSGADVSSLGQTSQYY